MPVKGSSPRGRGKLGMGGDLLEEHGLIPAWAGKTRRRSRVGGRRRAHPRVGGENRGSLLAGSFHSGSSPRGRGKRVSPKSSRQRRRLIPAWAGKTCGPYQLCWSSRAHPRVGGENDWNPRGVAVSHGSSPRGRGKQILPGVRGQPEGLIPAWAGKTPARKKGEEL